MRRLRFNFWTFRFWKSESEVLKNHYLRLSKREKLEQMIGSCFLAITSIKPSGFIKDYEGNRIDAVSEGEAIPENTIVRVVGRYNNFTVRVRMLE